MMTNRLPILIAAGVLAAAGTLPARNDPLPAEKEEIVKAAGPHEQVEPVATRPAHRRFVPLTKEQEAEVLELLERKRPAHYERLIRLREDDPRRYRMAVRAMHGFLRRWKHLPEEVRDAAMRERDARVRILLLVRRIRRTDDEAEKDALKTEVRQAVGEHFEAEQKLLESRLGHLEKRIESLRTELAQRRQQREQRIAERAKRWLQVPERPRRMHFRPHPGRRPGQKQERSPGRSGGNS